jgi:DNA invertase Pin-like site-specific DNA recombinase
VRREAIKKQGYFISKSGDKVYSMGAKAGVQQPMKLEKDKDKVLKYVNLGLNKTAIGILLKVSRITVSKFLKRYPIENGEYTR